MELVRASATDNFVQISGERCFVMGCERTGIGEIWVPPFRLIRSLRWGLVVDDMIQWANDCDDISFINRPEAVMRQINGDVWSAGESTACHRTDPAAVVRLDINTSIASHLVLEVQVNYRFMWPYPDELVTVDRSAWDADSNSFIFEDHRRLFALSIGFDLMSSQQTIFPNNSAQWKDGTLVPGPIQHADGSLLATAVWPINKGKSTVHIVVTGSDQGLAEARSVLEQIVANPAQVYESNSASYRQWLAHTVSITSPDPIFNEGYRWSTVGVDRHYLHTPGIGKGFVAGFAETVDGWGSARPGYAWYFGRDSVWTCLAVLAWGDFEKVRNQLLLLGDHQDISGKILHEISLSGVVHYDAADATPLYLILLGEYLRWSGDLDFIQSQWDRVKLAMAYLRRSINNDYGLIENRNSGHGWVEGGELGGSDVEVYLAGCWVEALKQLEYLSAQMGDAEEGAQCAEEFAIAKQSLDEQFWNDELRCYDVGIFADGRRITGSSILPAIPIMLGHLPYDRAALVAKTFSDDAMSTDWGVRIQPKDSRTYKPDGYHNGSVWPLFTGWAALAEYETHLATEGYQHIMVNLLQYQKGGLGWIDEVLHGDTGEPTGVCAHQAWSEAMVALPILRGMLGLTADAPHHKLQLRPHLPREWDSFRVSQIRLGDGRLSWDYRRAGDVVTHKFEWTGRSPLTVEFQPSIGAGESIRRMTLDGDRVDPVLRTHGNCTHLECQISVISAASLIMNITSSSQ